MRITTLFLASLIALSTAAEAQGPVDTATFTILGAGSAVATETVTFTRNADRGFTLTITFSGTRRMTSTLTTDSLGVPIAYQHHGAGGQAVEKRRLLKKDSSGALFLVEESSRNPPLSPFRMAPNALLFDEGGMAQHWFLGLGAAPREVAFILPASGRPTLRREQLSDAGQDSVLIDRTWVPARHRVLGSGGTRREVWIDAEGRLLKVLAPPDLVAVRTTQPR
jgi:hypothetical protein